MMKRLRLILTALVAIATLSLAACSDDKGGETPKVPEGENAIMSISLKGGSTTRAPGVSGDPAADNEHIKNYIAFAFKENGDLDAYKVSNDDQPKTFNVTTATKSVYVVANVVSTDFEESDGSSGMKSKFTTLAALKGHLQALTLDNATSVVTNKNVWASGFETVTFGPGATEGTWKADVTVKIYYAVAKVNFELLNDMTNKDATGEHIFKPKKVIVLNALAKSRFFAVDPTASKSLMPDVDVSGQLPYLGGMSVTGLNTAPQNNTVVSFFEDDVTGDAITAEKFHYYLLENDAKKFATIITVLLENGKSPAEQRYVSVHFDGVETDKDKLNDAFLGYKLVRNNQFQVNLKLKGDAAGEPGTTDPTDTKAELEVEVELQGWEPLITINKEL